jgi:hypothetical protein
MHRPLSVSQRAMFEQKKISKSIDGTTAQRRHNRAIPYCCIGHTRTEHCFIQSTCFPWNGKNSLLSVGQLCNEGYTVTFRNASVTICDSQGFQILSGARDLDTGLRRINLRKETQQPQQAVANNVYQLHNTGALFNYLHNALFSPKKSALLQAVKNGHIITWPGLTEKAINKHLKLTPATSMVHMNQRRQNIRSTSKTPITSDIEDFTTTNTNSGTKTHLVYAVLVDQGQLYTDLT